ncbi:MAG TPA: hypothetical protein VJX10_10985, partial [Pseudonocardiaceae bacterium]|nr:hypothetical protein [Pseudonocardiaceae bacterium]
MTAATFDPLEADQPVAARTRSGRWNGPLVAGLVLFGLIVLAALLAPVLTPYNPITQNLNATFLPP